MMLRSSLMLFGIPFLSAIYLVNAGTATVRHTCGYDIVCTFNNGRVDKDPDYQTIPANIPFTVAMDGPGQVIKCGKGDPTNIVQLEWSYGVSGATTWDVSFVNAAGQGSDQPFKDDGWMVSIGGVNIDGNNPTDSGWPKCWDSYCGCVVNCLDPNQVYLTPDSDKGDPDDNPVRTCPIEVDLTWNICNICPDQVPQSYKDHVHVLDQNPTRRETGLKHRPLLSSFAAGKA